MDVLDRSWVKKLLKNYKTGNVKVEKGTTDTEYLIFTAQKGTPDESKVTFSKEELKGIGIKSITKNADGDTIVTLTDDTTQNLGQWNGKNVQVEVTEQTPFTTKLKFKYYENDGTYKELITENIKGGNIYSGEEIDSQDKLTVVKIIDGSRVGDLYLNTKTDVLYRRTDDNSSAYTWTKIAELKGKTGDSNYEIWLEIPGNEGKSKVQYIEYMRNQFKQVKRVWDKPLLSDEGTDLNCIYYYQEGENAWLSKLYVPNDKDFGIGKYTYFDGIRWLSFENKSDVIPSHTMKDTLYFYCIYDEKSLKCRAHSVNKQTGEDKELGDGWTDLTISDVKPDDSYQLHETRLERLGKWKTTLYAGDTKADALEVTEDGTSSLDGVITTDIFNSILGTEDLETEDKTIKGAINEVYDKMKAIRDVFDLLHPVGCIIMQNVKPNIGEWQEITNMNGRALWLDSTKDFGTTITQALPKPSISISSNGSHSHSYGRISDTYSRVKIDADKNWGSTGSWGTGTTGSAGDHTHSATVATSGAYGTGSKVQPDAYVIKLWQRIG